MNRSFFPVLLFVSLASMGCDPADGELLGTGGQTASQGGASAGGMGGAEGGMGGMGGSPAGTPSGAPTGTPSGTPTGQPALPCAPTGAWDPAWEALEDELVNLINVRRLAGGMCGPVAVPPTNILLVDDAWRGVARAHAEDMATLDYLDWTAPDGESWLMQPAACGLNAMPFGANFTAGQTTAQQVLDGMVAGETTCMNLHGEGDVIGVGYIEDPALQFPTRWTVYLGTGN